MQRKSSSRQKAVVDVLRGPAGQALARAPREVDVMPAPASSHTSGETTLGGHVDRGLTLAALYDTGVLGRLRLEVRIRLLADLTQSLAWLHANPRLMAAYPHLVIKPSTIVIGLDGVARVDVRAAKKQEIDPHGPEAGYLAPELIHGVPAADHRADMFGLGVLGWEAIVGARLDPDDGWAKGTRLTEAADLSDVPAALGGREGEPLRRRVPVRSASNVSGTRCRVPPLTLPDGGDWAESIAALVMRAMCPEAAERLPDCRELLRELERMSGHLASTQEIAEVVQGISAVDTLCVPQPTLPVVDTACQAAVDQLGFMDRQPCASAAESCAQPRLAAPRRVVAPELPTRMAPLTVRMPTARPEGGPARSRTVSKLRHMSSGSSGAAWFAAGLVWLAMLGLLAGYAAALFRAH